MALLSLNNHQSHQRLTVNPPAQGVALTGRLRVPGDKSISHRALMLGAIATGETIIEGLLLGEDPRSTAHCFRAMGAEISELNSEKIIVQGRGLGQLQEPSTVLDAGNSGTTMRLMLGLLAGQKDCLFTVTGDDSLRHRPMSRVIQPLQQMGAKIWARSNGKFAPLAVQGSQLKPIHYHSPIASAQVKSCLLLAGLTTEGDTTVTEPALSRDHSERMLQAFGAKLTIDPVTHSVTVHGPAHLTGQRVVVPGDISSAAFWLVAASILPGSELLVENVGINPTRTGVLEVLAQMGADITPENERLVTGEPVADLRVRASHLQGCTFGGEIIPRLIDEIPILAVAAAFAEGTTRIEDAAELRVKESDRLAAIASELGKMGAKVTEFDDGLEIQGGSPLQGAEVDSLTDHRIAMALAIAALGSGGQTIINRAEAAAISYPEFFGTLGQVAQG
ncbi:3-phosphoshikimate 1-carboxyvinyltransferase [Synechocystis sp. PCC 6803]|uniref:3-phosphoshikimate 1-carboxyvinyltransferase n=1 Tax=Synechocystis sp. (strain ATCC 27184 / PCC 6803 / Kazusa) TaxID=1111708 RepID=AROA_SYNY3|nr:MULTISPECIES: 3-phosphoshikimate 1-carboxyvinyltransferase [unclassified Synechocystis]Q59975.1 RecName: Full=3-phosphoshikimate 1-carboxyvinyltransferase; AltName: Full=5-enolpyruvylshikimate-3-phosphate synthase; Short=EPSP synthase; Short=EPSPS [Synechocystis sp. PCC 6803 substr. Kazusa]BAM54798.1 3-phosphoshikimate 1-carboxyvinyltransferase [Synechocystis sp. PCC 6803] [Bacillus subtilis BEST7613]AGF52166.1 3-phosphoshikimate 1-carboxyvinyltransferase [Synechocystis sp. PCC 6803]ALJ68120